jgi:uncharacterized membrane protein
VAEHDDDYLFEKTRIEALTDGIFAVTMTLLVLELKLPERSPGDGPVAWATILEFLEPRMLSYVISFIVLCVFWMGHVRLMRLVRQVDHRFLWLSLVFILATTFVPFSTSLLGAHYRVQVVAIVYGANIAAILGAQYLLWCELLAKPPLRSDEPPPGLARVVHQRYGLALGVVVLAFALSFTHPRASTAAYTLLLLMGLFRPKPPLARR